MRSFESLALTALLCFVAACSDQTASVPGSAEPAAFVGRDACTSCHADAAAAWRDSHHDLAMQEAAAATVLGDFDSTTFTYYGRPSTFFKRGDAFFVRTEGPDGQPTDFEITYTFGIYPLQQYLVPFPGGRLQALSIVWDARPDSLGGQRWYHLYPDEDIQPGDVLHWTGSLQNWNYMCAACHSTNLQKNFILAENRYATSFSEIDVSCEACHGPGSRHLQWAAAYDGTANLSANEMGLTVALGDPTQATWAIDPATGNTRRSTPPSSRMQIETCAPCHARRSTLFEPYEHGHPLLDTHRPALLDAGLYHADGQIQDEVYVYGSFLQSAMYQKGVTCTDCHDPHSLELKAPGNALCGSCHLATKYDTPAHHFHEPGTAGAACVDCHMPSQVYMGIDDRRDHSLRIPRPDLSEKLGSPNACNQCHTDRSAAWAADAIADGYGPSRRTEAHFGEALLAGRMGRPDAPEALAQLAADTTMPAIARATALQLLRDFPRPLSVQTAERFLLDPDPLLRLAAAGTMALRAPQERLAVLAPLLTDTVRAVRLEAANLLAPVPSHLLSTPQREALDGTLREYITAQLVNADRPEAHLNLGVLYALRGQLADAEQSYRTALRLQPAYAAAYVNLADLYRSQGRDAAGEATLREALEVAPDNADVHHALGLLLVRQQRYEEALQALGRAVRLQPDHLRYAYVYGVALNSTGRPDQAVAVLERALENHPYDRDVLVALATINRDRGALREALRYARELAAQAPDDPGVQRLVADLAAAAEGGE